MGLQTAGACHIKPAWAGGKGVGGITLKLGKGGGWIKVGEGISITTFR